MHFQKCFETHKIISSIVLINTLQKAKLTNKVFTLLMLPGHGRRSYTSHTSSSLKAKKNELHHKNHFS